MGRIFSWLLLAAFTVGCWTGNVPSAWSQPATNSNPDAERIARLIKELGDDTFSVREAAQHELLKLDEPAKAALQAAADSSDIEISRRARFILREFARRRIAADVNKVTWEIVLDRVRQHAAKKHWQDPGFTDELLEEALEKLIDQANALSKDLRLKLPARFADCRPARGRDGALNPSEFRGENLLFCGRGSFSLQSGVRSIVLVDGSVNLSYATDCLIIARGAVTVAHGSGNVILAGQFINVSHDGSRLRPGPMQEEGSCSLMMSGGILRIAHAQRAVCYAPAELSISHGTDCLFLNRTTAEINPRNGSAAPDAKLLFVPAAKPNPLQDRLKITQVLRRDSEAENLAIMERNGVELVIRPGGEIKDSLGQPIPEFAGWKLDFVAERLAIFSNGQEDACFQVGRRE